MTRLVWVHHSNVPKVFFLCRQGDHSEFSVVTVDLDLRWNGTPAGPIHDTVLIWRA